MKKLKKTPKLVLLTSLGAIIFGGVAVGFTYALFTSEAETKVIATAGKINVSSEINGLQTYSGINITDIVSDDAEKINPTSKNGQFTNGGTASIDEEKKTLTLDKMTAGDRVTFNVDITNFSNVNSKYRTVITCSEDDGLYSGLKITTKVGETSSVWDNGFSIVSDYTILAAVSDLEIGEKIKTIEVTIDLPSNTNDTYQDKSCKLSCIVEAIQGNAYTSAYDESALYLYGEHDLRLFADYINSGSSVISSYSTFKLASDVALTKEWTPIGQKKGAQFTKTFDGDNHIVSNLNVTPSTVGYYITSKKTDALKNEFNGYGAFFGTVTNATIKNLKVSGSVSCDNAGGIVAYMNGGTIENCTSNVTVIGAQFAGGIICSADGKYYKISISNCTNNGEVTIANDTEYSQVLVGGIISSSSYQLNINNCTNNGNIGNEKSDYSGGIIGFLFLSSATIENSINAGSVTGVSNVGGIIGFVYFGKSININKCSNLGQVSAQESGEKGEICTLDKESTVTIDGETKIGPCVID